MNHNWGFSSDRSTVFGNGSERRNVGPTRFRKNVKYATKLQESRISGNGLSLIKLGKSATDARR